MRSRRHSRYDYEGGYGGFPAYVPVAQRAARAAKQAAALEKKGKKLSPIALVGRTIASTFWGKAWCRNLESYSDYASRLPRGRSYVRHGAVIDLQIEPGKVTALVQGTSLYTVTIGIGAVDPKRWQAIVSECGGKIGSVVELLSGKLSKAVMEVISHKDTGLFPAPRQIQLACSCPDWASMCKHVAAVLYGVGARLDAQPELLFRLRGADPTELISKAAAGALLGGKAPVKERRLDEDLASVFGIDLDPGPVTSITGGGSAIGRGDRRADPGARRSRRALGDPVPASGDPPKEKDDERRSPAIAGRGRRRG